MGRKGGLGAIYINDKCRSHHLPNGPNVYPEIHIFARIISPCEGCDAGNFFMNTCGHSIVLPSRNYKINISEKDLHLLKKNPPRHDGAGFIKIPRCQAPVLASSRQ